ncbi:hypothetical protein [Paraurantiacibacter namhicola]|uniref:Uncharacterized protein n=1 Tax=Paraurantiacibacter namhicola TaxID=645517 RepID=A0A1C7D6A5_9SPHN|nr:hypothetical protein [Paraurantiacibacter namhicola]ANU06861.1 hypothetical protein A6F65_00538 [Paraurantiacibacter namhicola]
MTGPHGAAPSRGIQPEVRDIAGTLAREANALAVLFYGSNLRTGSLEGVLDFYVLTGGAREKGIWPRVSYREFDQADGTRLRAKIATMNMATFAHAASGTSRDTTIWSRFVQPCAAIWTRDDAAARKLEAALDDAAQTAALLAAALGPPSAPERAYWKGLFRATYKAELRVEAPGREAQILDVNASHFDGLLAPALERAGVPVSQEGDMLHVTMAEKRRAEVLAWWKKRQRLGKPINLLRLAKATTTFEGAARYGAWKLERHSGIALEMTPFRERHPILAAPGAALEYWRKKRTRAASEDA